jgi:hypothetical protein
MGGEFKSGYSLVARKSAVLATSSDSTLIVAAALPGWDESSPIAEVASKVVLGELDLPLAGIDPLLAARVVAVLYGGVVLVYNRGSGVAPISRLLPDEPVRVEGPLKCSPPSLTASELLDLWASLALGERGVLERLGACTVEPRGLRLVAGKGEPLPPIGFVGELAGSRSYG